MKSPLVDTPHSQVPKLQANPLIKALSIENLMPVEMINDSLVDTKGRKKKRQTSAGSRRSRGN